MKKLIFLIPILFVITSCGFTYTEFEDPIEDRLMESTSDLKEVELEGFLKSQEISVTSKFTHALYNENSEIISKIKSSKLSLVPYEELKVKVKGRYEVLNDGEKVLEVYEIEEIVEDTSPFSEEEILWKKYKETDSLFSFEYPEIWKIVRANKVTYLKKDNDNIVKITGLQNPNNAPVSTFVSGEHQEVTINGTVALKQTKENGFDLYLKAPETIIKISFNADKADEQRETYFYSFLESFSFSENSKELQKCGGSENILCSEGFRCELTRGNSGVCIDITSTDTEYEEFGTFTEDKEEIKKSENIEIDMPEEKVNEKVLLEDINFDDGRLYENKYMNFSLQYPKSWWFKSFGTKEGSLWHIEFAEKEIENIGDGIIMVDVKSGVQKLTIKEDGGKTTILLPKNSNSYLEITGYSDQSENIRKIASSFVENLESN